MVEYLAGELRYLSLAHPIFPGRGTQEVKEERF
jgi:hypothetical protein